jgi:ankyrin repeat protein
MGALLSSKPLGIVGKVNSMKSDLFELVTQKDFEKLLTELNKNKRLLHIRHSLGYSLLHVVSEFGPPDLVQFLIDEGLDPNDRDESGETPLFWAVAEPNLQAADVLLANGAELEVFNDEGFAPIHTAVYDGGTETIDYLLSKEVSIDLNSRHGTTLLHTAAGALDKDLILFLIEKGSDINYQDNRGWTPLMYSIMSSSVYWDLKIDISDNLLKLGADPNIRSIDGKNAWDFVQQFTKDGFLKLLRK